MLRRALALMLMLGGCVPAGGGGGGGDGSPGPADGTPDPMDGGALDAGEATDAGDMVDGSEADAARPPGGGLDEPCLPGDVCDPGLTCDGELCLSDPACDADCLYGQTACADERGFTVCGGALDDACPRESRRIPCGDGRSCVDGACGGDCTRPEVLVLLDRSSSMAGERWAEVRAALTRWAGEVDPVVRLGLRVFPGSGCDAGEVLPIGRGNAAALEAALAEMPSPDAATPIAAALTGLAPAFGDPDEAQFALLITDGSETCAEPADALAAVRALRTDGIRTAVIGVGNGADPVLLDALGRAGGAPPPGERAFALADDGPGIYAALVDMLRRAETCCVDPDEDGRGPLCDAGPDCAPDEPAAWTGAVEICDGVDNDCSGAVDDGLEAPLAEVQDGVCVGTRQVCDGVDGWQPPSAGSIVGYEADETRCDAQDNDCDGAVDEGVTRRCQTACGSGDETCVAGDWVDCDAPPPTRETCDGIDEDCNGDIDDGDVAELCPEQPNADPVACDAGACRYACRPDWRDADGDLGALGGTGCEAPAWTALAVGTQFACGLRQARIECWGEVADPPAGRFTAIDARADSACALDEAGQISCWNGELTGFVLPGRHVALATARGAVCGLDAEGQVTCGPNNFWAEDPPPAPVTALAAGWAHACAVIADGTPRCWWVDDGSAYRQNEAPANEQLVSLVGGSNHSCGLRADGSGTCWGAGLRDCGQNCFPHRNQSRIPGNERFVHLAAGSIHTCGVRVDGTLLCWGSDQNGDGRLEVPAGRYTRVWGSANTMCALREDGAAVCWGDDGAGQASPPD